MEGTRKQDSQVCSTKDRKSKSHSNSNCLPISVCRNSNLINTIPYLQRQHMHFERIAATAKSNTKRTRAKTHPMRFLSIANQLQQLLIRHKSLEPRIIRIRAVLDNRPPMTPLDILRLGEHLLEQLILRAQANIHHAVPESQLVAAQEALVERRLGVAVGEELDVAVHGLAVGAVHDDVDGHANLRGEDFGVAAEEAKDFLLGQGVGDLFWTLRSS